MLGGGGRLGLVSEPVPFLLGDSQTRLGGLELFRKLWVSADISSRPSTGPGWDKRLVDLNTVDTGKVAVTWVPHTPRVVNTDSEPRNESFARHTEAWARSAIL